MTFQEVTGEIEAPCFVLSVQSHCGNYCKISFIRHSTFVNLFYISTGGGFLKFSAKKILAYGLFPPLFDCFFYTSESAIFP